MKVLHFITVGFLILAGNSLSHAARRPSFYLDYSLWKATHIVLATEGNVIDGRLKVIESWKGDLKPDSKIILPELATFSTEKSRRIQWWKLKDMPKPFVHFVTGSKMVLFLVQKPVEAPKESLTDSNTVTWLPASYNGYGGFKVSVVWIENGEAYAFMQVDNPGPSVLIHLSTGIEMKSRLAAFNVIQAAHDNAVKDGDPVRAIQSFRTFHRNKFYYAASANIESVGRMGIKALPILRQSLQDRTLQNWHPEIISSMVTAGGANVAKDLTTVIEKQLEFWSRRAPDLKEGWWNADPATERRILREKYGILLTALRKLRSLRYPPCRDIVVKIRDLWLSNTILSFNGRSQVIEACDAVLKELSSLQQK
ncbi:MAG: hypothetical protein ACYS6K_05525 [Planctomycetota bacterium]|jgi:hypothetical protein